MGNVKGKQTVLVLSSKNNKQLKTCNFRHNSFNHSLPLLIKEIYIIQVLSSQHDELWYCRVTYLMTRPVLNSLQPRWLSWNAKYSTTGSWIHSTSEMEKSFITSRNPMMWNSLLNCNKTRYVIGITAIGIVSIHYFSTDYITPSQPNFNSTNNHTWRGFHFNKVISGRKNKTKLVIIIKKEKRKKNAVIFQNHISRKGYYYSWGLCGWLTWHANNWKGTS